MRDPVFRGNILIEVRIEIEKSRRFFEKRNSPRKSEGERSRKVKDFSRRGRAIAKMKVFVYEYRIIAKNLTRLFRVDRTRKKG